MSFTRKYTDIEFVKEIKVCVYECWCVCVHASCTYLMFSADSGADCVLLPPTTLSFFCFSLFLLLFLSFLLSLLSSLSAHTFILFRSIRSVASPWHREWRGTWEGCFVICQVVPPTEESHREGEGDEWN